MAGGQVFALQRGELLRYDTAGGDFVPAGLSPVPGNMLADSLEGLYLFSCQEQTLTQLETAAPYDTMATWKVDPLPFTADEIYRAVVAEGVLYLLTARDVDCLSHAPFLVDELFGRYAEPRRRPFPSGASGPMNWPPGSRRIAPCLPPRT